MATQRNKSSHAVRNTFLILTALVVAIGGFYYYRLKTDPGTRQNLKEKGLNIAGQWMETNVKDMDFTIKEITSDSIKSKMTLVVHNTLPVDVNVDSLGYVIAIEGDTLIRGSQSEPIAVKANADGRVTLPMNSATRPLVKKIDKLQRDSADVFMRTIVYSHFPVVGQKSVPMELKQKVYIPKLPKFEVEKVKVNKLGLKGGELAVRMKITNFASIPFTIRSMRYRFRLSDNVDVKGKESQDISFTKKGEETVEIPVKMDLDQIGEAAFKMLFKGKSTPYQMDGTMAISTHKNFVGDFDMDFNSKGTVQELKNMAKQAIKAKEAKEENDERQQ